MMMNPVVAQSYHVNVKASPPSDEATTSIIEKNSLDGDTVEENKVN